MDRVMSLQMLKVTTNGSHAGSQALAVDRQNVSHVARSVILKN